MSSNYAGLNVQHGQITIPSDGDPAIAESVNTSLRDLMDNSVYANTELGFKIDTRGGVNTLTGNVTIQGTPNLTLAVDVFHTNDTTFGATALSGVVAGWDELRWFGDANLRGEARIGSGPTQALDIRSTTSVFGPIRTFSDTTLGNSSADDLTIEATTVANAPVTVNATTQIGTDSAHTCTIGGPVVAQRSVTCEDNLSVDGSTSLGNSSSDTHTFRGPVTFRDDISTQSADATVDGDLDVAGNSVLGSTSGDSCTIPASLTVSGPMTLSGALTSALAYSGFGRVPAKVAIITATTTVNVGSGQLFSVQGTGVTIAVSMSDVSATAGDWMIFAKTDQGGAGSVAYSFTLTLPSGVTIASIPAGAEGAVLAFRTASGWVGLELA